MKKNKMKFKNQREEDELKKALQISIFLSLSLVLQIAESFMAVPLFLPGIKLGLANVVTVTVLYYYGIKEAFKIGIMRVVLSSLLRNGLGINFLFAVSGTTLSILVSGFLKKYSKMSVKGISMAGANFHVTGQIVIASVIYRTELFYVSYLPYMLLITFVTGYVTGHIAERILYILRSQE